ncbi:hypothetical protein [Rhizobium leguminosarum]|uniref:hypothetical protein n=1 Tax=Rhizobium leguminosarum TaxID=384 RepID=UPI001FED7D5E|nr:hypothetical protein [Rhizobium leguminosarum]
MGIPTGGMTASAGEQSELDDRTNQLQKDLSSDGYTVIRELLTADQVESLQLIVTQYLKSEGRYPDRIALFMTFGPPNEWTHSYREACLTRQGDCRHDAGSAESESIVTPHAR